MCLSFNFLGKERSSTVQFGDSGAEKIAEALKRNTTWTSLDLVASKIEDLGAIHLAEALTHNTTLKSLFLHSMLPPNLIVNYIRDEGAKALAEALTKNTTLTYLDLRGNYDFNCYSESNP